jgi:hypothetical protein
LGEFLLRLQTSSTGAALLGHYGAKRVFPTLTMQRKLPRLDRPQRDWHSGRLGIGTLVVLKQFGMSEGFQQLSVRVHGLVFLAFVQTMLLSTGQDSVRSARMEIGTGVADSMGVRPDKG